ncbi:transketolase [Chlorobium phaeobacteroides]|uniref:Transketolase n=1 Tax=Chlorobium phaeobacteroides (strain DSM 266 / SMG 266 / 2430) TaxID=290317 RepID=A1BIC6_CHLPD|nr:transketolase [Chlorobium phaeobacteroides]ABL66153.1 transketolase [Chlorobium phaeobacteroides DSM 266]
MPTEPIDLQTINTARVLAVDMVEKAGSGHPGMPLGAAPMAVVLFTKIMNHNPANPKWLNRDRFVLSAGHGSALLYALLHLTGYDLSLDDLKSFRQWESKTPGHPEYGVTPGVEMTTGPLGQGISTAVGMAIAERFCAKHLNCEELELIDYYTYVICGDGDLMEGVSSETASLAGHLKLGKLICLYDSNRISIEGSTTLAFTENVGQRFLAFGWHVEHFDGNDPDAVEKALLFAKTQKDRPSLLIAHTNIGFGSPNKQDSAAAHGEPLGSKEVILLKRGFGFPEEKTFEISDAVKEHLKTVKKKGSDLEERWNALRRTYTERFPAASEALEERLQNRLPEGWEKLLPGFDSSEKLATRQASKKVLDAICHKLPFLAGGSADLAPSCGTLLNGGIDFTPAHYNGANLRFGVREHAMGAIINGMALSQIIIPYGATFLVFSDYMKPALRLAALMKTHSIFIFTHDSIALGEDGPTHQPIEQLAMLRSLPGMVVLRPADANETKEAWKIALTARRPVCLIFSRQTLPVLDADRYPICSGVRKGGYILSEWNKEPQTPEQAAIIIATGAEVHTALEAQNRLAENGVSARVVSMPSTELFEEQPQPYRLGVLPENITNRVVIEAASSFGWHRYATDRGKIIGIDHFGASAPGNVTLEKFGFTASHIFDTVQSLLHTA